MSALPHVLLTRYNLPTGGVEGLRRAQEGWLRERTELFDRYAVPSVRAQTLAVHWIVYLDPQSPRWLLDHLGRYADEGLLVPVLREEVSGADLHGDIRSVVGAADRVVTSNLDNDDGLARDFSARVRAADPGSGRAAVYLTRGLIRRGDEIYLRVDRDNAFCSVVEPAAELGSCWVDWHNRLHRHMPVVEVDGPAGWLQVVHGRNVSNRVKGVLVAPTAYRPVFGDLLDGVSTPSPTALWADRVLRAPVRRLRDGARGGARDVLVAGLGKDRVTRLKGILAGAVRRGRS